VVADDAEGAESGEEQPERGERDAGGAGRVVQAAGQQQADAGAGRGQAEGRAEAAGRGLGSPVRSKRAKTRTRTNSTAAHKASHTGRSSHHRPSTASLAGHIPVGIVSAATTTRAVWCHRYTVIAAAPATTIPAHARERASQRSTGERTAATIANWATPSANNATDGGELLLRCPGSTPTIATG